jgi:hypothetical protein
MRRTGKSKTCVWRWQERFMEARRRLAGSFVLINYLKDWAIVRDVAEKSGVPYNRNTYDAEARREADADCFNRGHEAPNIRPKHIR